MRFADAPLRRPATVSGDRAGARRSLLLGPGVERGMRLARVVLQLVLRGRLGSELEPDAVGVEEIDRLHETMIGDAEHLDAVGFETRFHDLDVLYRGHLH